MNAFVRRMGTILIAALLIVATGGYSVYRHYCYSEDKTLVSVFSEKMCDHDVVSDVPSCCSMPAGTTEENDHCRPDSDCCHTSSFFFKISDLFTLKIDPPTQELNASIIQVTEVQHNLQENIERATGYVTPETQPPPGGKEFLISTHQMKIAPDLA